ncbi:multidrug transporter [Rathayibacter iranicus]|uniref:Multidrug transporter n=2 Tax=Rathayibacter iranicus TaxID=59737 RepID=A0AAD1AHB2_9MICO|nr:multidrug transporter [Rathayibacter iranicus]AZZ56291.1 multidrug transporter [Rathayibacter iranicus]MWV29990.1 multidrug transporter [Rathayibacter iranicus NCPPB 2253 = VKM Ac-1602]PPI45903.1 multidrug transporter [Rathayibacter iranicus]PPI59732.1 multidrug transporter [Rathayibacter iranicus]PPI70741.1 multidrug transporter [Rathayibacter iranicus]
MSDQSADDRHDQLTSAPHATEADAAPRIDVSTTAAGDTRIDIREDADVRPGRVDENGESRDDA